MAKLMRLDKYLVEMNKGSRTQIKDAAKKGRIQVNGVPEKKTERKIDPETDEVTFDGQAVSYRAMEYIMLYKPQGVISATEDKRHRTVIDLLSGENRSDLFPVGRLDIDTEGLLLLTNDGDLTHRLLAPGKHVDKVYFARIEGKLPETAVEQMAAGLTLTDGTPVMPGKLEILKQWEKGAEILLTIQEGKFHQVKRMFEALGCQVVFLKRLSMGSLKLDPELKPGEYRPLTEEELELLGK
ncbi:pseudouridine synthase [Ventrimonas sp. CLA-AP-H27]|uniref:Pseudouridine synthase n=1 Tax=Ventrimonas faecis TaxID=3133170 RepID=A0ABV1HHR2_9FIRM